MKYSYDLHIHSCLSPCADDDMTPANIAGMAYIKGLDIIALTDHNTCKNCPAFFKACHEYGITPIAGMELTTAEDIHLVCLFKNLQDAMSFSDYVYTQIPDFKNNPNIFGNQVIMDENDNVVLTEEKLLITATSIDVNSAVEFVSKYGGVVFPAHIDRRSNGIIAILGDIPFDAEFTSVEFNDYNNKFEYENNYALVGELRHLCSSDAHNLGTINEPENFIELDTKSAENLIHCLKTKK